MPFGTYTIGLAMVIGALICGASLLHVPTHWMVVGWILLVGQGVLIRGVTTRQRNSAPNSSIGEIYYPFAPRD